MERFQAKVRLDEASGCHLWTAARDRDGYGRFRASMMVVAVAHRWIWEQIHGPIPEGYVVCHHCDTPSCVNADHLFVGTHADNVRDREAKGRGVRPVRR